MCSLNKVNVFYCSWLKILSISVFDLGLWETALERLFDLMGWPFLEKNDWLCSIFIKVRLSK